jgi:hypothetical protein
MDNFNEYLKGTRFTLYRDLATETTLGTTQLKTLNRLRNTLMEHSFEVKDCQNAELPDFLKKRQIEEGQEISRSDQASNKVIHVDLIKASSNGSETSERGILSITDDNRTFSRIADDKIDSLATAIWHQVVPNPTEIRTRSCPTKARYGPANWKAESTVLRRWD